MKICHLTSAHPSTDGRIFRKECTSLAENGNEVYLVARGDSRKENNVSVVGIGYENVSRFKRMFEVSKVSYKKAIALDCDVYHLHDPELLLYVKKLKRIGKKVIFDSHEDVPSQICEKEYLPSLLRKAISYLYEKFQNNILKECDAVISVTPDLVEKLKKVNCNSYLVTNFPIYENITRSAPKDKICFAGGVSKQWQHEVILDAIEGIDVIYTLCGSVEPEYLEKLKNHREWHKVNYLGVVPHSEVKKLLASSLCGMAILEYNLNAGLKTGTLGNTKIFEYMMSGIPVVCTDFSLWKNIVRDNKCGLVVNPYDVEEVRKAILFYKNNIKENIINGNNGKNLVREKFNWKTQEKVLLALYEKLK